MLRLLLAALLCLTLAACFNKQVPLYETEMGVEPWTIVQERQDEISKLTPGEQKLINGLAAKLRLAHIVTGYPEPKATFRTVLKAQYGAQFDEALAVARKLEADARQAKAAE
jgi:hypothetical protein